MECRHSEHISTPGTLDICYWLVGGRKDNMLLGSIGIPSELSEQRRCVCLYWMPEPRCLTWVVCCVSICVLTVIGEYCWLCACGCGQFGWFDPLHLACKFGHCGRVRMLLAARAPVDSFTSQQEYVVCIVDIVPVWVVRVWSCAWHIVLLQHNTCKWA